MAGGTYIDHANIETLLGKTLSSSTVPSDAQVDAWCVQAEALANAELYPATLADISDSATRLGILQSIVMRLYQRWMHIQKIGGASSQDGVAYSDGEIITNEIRVQLHKATKAEIGTVTLFDE